MSSPWFEDVTTTTDKRMMWVYVLGALLVVVIIGMILNYGFNALPAYLDPRSTKSKVNWRAQEFWSAPDMITPLRVSTRDIRTKIPEARYTVMFEMLWLNTRTSGNTETSGALPYRHILHRGSGETAAITQGGLLDFTGSSSGSTGPLGTLPFGLPTRMNPGIMADPYTNDMLIFVDTQRSETPLRESLRIPDIPLDQPIYLSVVLLENVLEVYINCRLEATKVLEGRPRSIEQEWYGLTGAHALAAQIQRLKLWDYPLTHKELRDLCPLPITFGPPNIKCPSE